MSNSNTTALAFSPEEAAAAKAETDALISGIAGGRELSLGEKSSFSDAIQSAYEWSLVQLAPPTPWYKKPSTWVWILGGALLLGGGIYVVTQLGKGGAHVRR